MEQEYITQMSTEYGTREREYPKQKVEPWADTLEEADLI